MVWEGQMAPRQSTATAEERYLKGLMTPEEKFEYEKQRYAQGFTEQDAAQAQLDEQANAERAAAEQAARLQEQMALGPQEAAYQAKYHRPSPGYIAPPSPNWVLEDPKMAEWQAPAEAPGADLAVDPLGATSTGLTYDDKKDEPGLPAGADYAGQLRELQKQYGGKEGLIRKAEGRHETRQKDIADKSGVTAARSGLEKAEGVLNTATQKLANWEINPQRAFPNAFSKIAAVISVAMGAYAQGLSGGKLPNTALQIIDGAIKTDIDAQKMEYQKLKGLVDEKRNVYGMAMRLLGNAEQAEQVAYSAAFQTYQAEINKLGKEYGLAYGAIDLSSKIDFRKRQLAAAVARQSASGLKMSKEARTSLAGASAVKDMTNRVAQLGKEVGASWGPLTWLSGALPFAKTDAKVYNQAADQLVITIVNALSGKQMTEFEVKTKFGPWTPKAADSTALKQHKLKQLLSIMSNRAAGWLGAESNEVKQMVLGEHPELAPMMLGTPESRTTAVNSYVNQLMDAHEGVGDSSFSESLGGESVTGKK